MASHFVHALRKGLEVLRCFDRTHPRLTLSEVAELTGMSAASARRALLTLHELGYLDHDGRHFWMRPNVLLLARGYLTSRPTPSLVQPMLDLLSERSRESASVGKLLEKDVIIIARSTARRSLTSGLGIGSLLPVHASATGRVLLAALKPEEARRRIGKAALAALTPRTVTQPRAIERLVEAAREGGFALCDEEIEVGVRSMAVPVLDQHGNVTAALSIAMRTDRLTAAEFVRTFLPMLLRVQRRWRQTLVRDD